MPRGASLSRALRFPIAVLLLLFAAGCAADIVRVAPPAESWRFASSPVAPGARAWTDEAPPDAGEQSRQFFALLRARFEADLAAGRESTFTALALSGGAEDGAFGAGVLKGWTDAGGRPEFDIVTGVSTGALIAPFAFVGSSYDPDLKRFFTETSTEDIFEIAIFSALTGSLGLVDTTPLQDSIATVVTAEFLAAVAKEHARGRRLFIGTTNIDARRSVIWDMGVIAQRGTPEALQLFRKVMLASASIPGAFPPVFFDVEIDGRIYQEMHVDGGVISTVFIAPNWIEFDDDALGLLKGRTTVYVIQNNKIVPNYGPEREALIDIASTSISEMIRSQATGDHLRIYALTQLMGFEYRVAHVPAEFLAEAQEAFDPDYMRALFRLGYRLGATGEAWSDTPPKLPVAILHAPSAPPARLAETTLEEQAPAQ